MLDGWRFEYNNDRPHSSLNHESPVQFKAGWSTMEDPSELKNLRYCWI